MTNVTEKIPELPSDATVFALRRVDPRHLDHVGVPFVLVELTTVVGRDARACQLVLDDPSVSRQHVRLRFVPRRRRFEITDLGSSNGLFVNGRRTMAGEVGPNDVVRLGNQLLVVTEVAEAALRASQRPQGVCVPGVSATAVAAEAVFSALVPGQRVTAVGEPGTARAWAIRRLAARLGCADRLLRLHGTSFRAAGWEAGLTAWIAHASAAGGGVLHLDDLHLAPREAQERLAFVLEASSLSAARITVAASLPTPRRGSAPSGVVDGLLPMLAPPIVHFRPLRTRREDVAPLLALTLAERGRVRPAAAAATVVEALLLHGWPGNVSELSALVDLLAAAGRLEADFDDGDLPGRLLPFNYGEVPATDAQRLSDALRASEGNVSAAARALGISRRHFYRLAERHGVGPDDWRADAIPTTGSR